MERMSMKVIVGIFTLFVLLFLEALALISLQNQYIVVPFVATDAVVTTFLLALIFRNYNDKHLFDKFPKIRRINVYYFFFTVAVNMLLLFLLVLILKKIGTFTFCYCSNWSARENLLNAFGITIVYVTLGSICSYASYIQLLRIVRSK